MRGKEEHIRRLSSALVSMAAAIGVPGAALAEEGTSAPTDLTPAAGTVRRFQRGGDGSVIAVASGTGGPGQAAGAEKFKLVRVEGTEKMASVPFRVGDASGGAMCEAPCTVRLGFREGEESTLTFETPQRTFRESWRLTESSPDFGVQVIQGGSSRRLYGGIGLVIAGIPTLALGGLGGFGYAVEKSSGLDRDYMSPEEKLHDVREKRRKCHQLAVIGGVGTALGLAGIVVGSWWIHTGRSRIRVIPKETDAGSVQSGSVQSASNVSFGIVPVLGGASAVASGEF